MSQATRDVRWTIQDIEALPEDKGIRYEIIDGELFVTRSPLAEVDNVGNSQKR